MNAIIHELVRVDAQHRVMLVNLRLAPGEEVELTVRPSNAEQNTASPTNSLWQLSERLQLDAPSNYSVNFEQALG